MLAYNINMVSDVLSAKSVIVAHRGDAAHHPENSLAAFASAAELGLHWIELDVQVTADGVPIVLHDPTLTRTHSLNVEATGTTLDKLAALGVLAGGNHPPPVPTLTEFTDWMRAEPQMHVFVEIKKESLRAHGRQRVLTAIEAGIDAIRDRAVIISYDARVLAMARRDGWPIGYALERMDRRYRSIAERLAPDFLFAEVAHLERAGKLWPGPWQWAAFELEDAAPARRIAALGVTYLETMNPRLLIETFGVKLSPISESFSFSPCGRGPG